jgi:ElaA protein
MTTLVHGARFADLDGRTLYRLLQLRVDVFVVEQRCPYRDLDGRDVEPETRHLWVEDGDQVVACLRLLDDGGDVRIGRVVTAPAQRGQGLAAALIRAAIGGAGARPVVLDAQSHLTAWYGSFGFRVDGPEFVEDGILHTPMRRVAE